MDETPKGWYSRGYLPRCDGGSIVQFVTCRLFDSLPQRVLDGFLTELDARKPEDIQRERLILIDKYLDSGYGGCFLRLREVAEIVRDSLVKFDNERYKLIAWVIMPNHIHVLLKPLNGWDLDKILHSFKSFTASEANRVLKRSGKFWMRESFDRFIRDDQHFERTIRYIANNPVKAGLCDEPNKWEFSSFYISKYR